ncbi:uncharacterized protein LOC123015602 [Tribolium madens]|uniref:uncharacterized protein LOC123015602 n=1 Tax=Tribolium madens TaxID=41895 RepID=UPI001CF73155|nr:uncharacterized protein LOC123015602 [Tribolium madens]
MEQNKLYRLTGIKRHSTKFGDRLMAELDGVSKLYLPERYNAFTDRQVQDFNGANYFLVNKGLEGKSYKLILKSSADIEVPKSADLIKVTSEIEIGTSTSTQDTEESDLEEEDATMYYTQKNTNTL